MNSTFSLLLTIFLELHFRRAFCHTNACAIVSIAALSALKPDILSFTLFFSHMISPQQAGLLMLELSFQAAETCPEALCWCKHASFLNAADFKESLSFLFNDLGNHTGTDSSSTFTDSKAKPIFHSDWRYNLHFHRYIITRQTHFCTLTLSALKG